MINNVPFKNIYINIIEETVLGIYPVSVFASDIVWGELKAASIVTPYKNEVHRIVPWNDPRVLEARNILDDYSIDYNFASNSD